MTNRKKKATATMTITGTLSSSLPSSLSTIPECSNEISARPTTATTVTTVATATTATATATLSESDLLIRSLNTLDPILQFLTRSSGQTSIPLRNLQATIPNSTNLSVLVPYTRCLLRLVRYGVIAITVVVTTATTDDDEEEETVQTTTEYLQLPAMNQADDDDDDHDDDHEMLAELEHQWNTNTTNNIATGTTFTTTFAFRIGFPSPISTNNDSNHKNDNSDTRRLLCGSTKTAAKRRLATLKRCLKQHEKEQKQKQKNEQKELKRGKKYNTNANENENENYDTPTMAAIAATASPLAATAAAAAVAIVVEAIPDDDNKTNDSNNNIVDIDTTITTTTVPTPVSVVETRQDREREEAIKVFQKLLGMKYDNDASLKLNSTMTMAMTTKTNKYKAVLPSNNADDNNNFDHCSTTSNIVPLPTTILPKQLSYAGTHPAQTAEYENENENDDDDDNNNNNNGFFKRRKHNSNTLPQQSLSSSIQSNIHPVIKDIFGLNNNRTKKKDGLTSASTTRTNNSTTTTTTTNIKLLYRHQVEAIQSILVHDRHTLICTGTGSGKSLCFLIPILQQVITTGYKSLVLFPTKALAQDQYSKLQSLLQGVSASSSHLDDENLLHHICPGILDGDTSYAQRSVIASTCNIIFTNPDTLHASILPNFNKQKHYRTLLTNLKYIVIDEAHMYEGVFGAHVKMIIARLYRVHCCINSSSSNNNNNNNSTSIEQQQQHQSYNQDSQEEYAVDIDTADVDSSGNTVLSPLRSVSSALTFIACSATLAHPEHHFRLLCCLPSTKTLHIPVTVIMDDYSPRAAKHFFVWNPPLLDEQTGKSLGYVIRAPISKLNKTKKTRTIATKKNDATISTIERKTLSISSLISPEFDQDRKKKKKITYNSSSSNNHHRRRRRHSADETALLLARAVSKGIRCIAFCKTRCLVEWVYERCIKTLKQSSRTAHLVTQIDSYRGYSKMERRKIEEKLFHNQLLGVVGTSALELGVDIGGVCVTLHCGFPSSHASLMQQAGRAGRGAAASHRPSLAICVCFNSPIDQHLWRHPSSLLSRGLSAPLNMPIYPGLVMGHLLCAGNEFPLTGGFNVRAIQTIDHEMINGLLSDEDLFGSKHVYREALENLLSKGSLYEENNIAIYGDNSISVFKTHPSIKNSWSKVSIRSIETVNYDIVDISHPMQRNQMGGCHHEAAIMDNIPYSRVFYHAFPGAIITHRGRRYKIVSMTRPPAFGVGYCSSVTLGAYATVSTHRYCTRPLSNMKITVVKQLERVDLFDNSNNGKTSNINEATIDPTKVVADVVDDDPSIGSFAGCGWITVKRNVHGYKKISLVTRDELSRSELSLPDMEYDTGAFWIDCDVSGLGRFMTSIGFGYGVHALSHALCNVAPLFVPCVLNDMQCDHSFYNPTRVVIFDSRAGGSGIAAQLWNYIFIPNGLLHAAIDLLEFCPSCSEDVGYTGGCPACIQAGECIKFNDFLCKSNALIIAKHMLQRIQKTETYKKNELNHSNSLKKRKDDGSTITAGSSPRREKRRRGMQAAMDVDYSKQKQLVIGRPCWPMDISDGNPRQQQTS